MSKTLENLMAAFAGESQANRKYLAYAQAADKEGLSGVAKVFRAAAAAETIHAHTHLKNAGKIGDTAANLQDAIGGETYEFTKMYPEMIKDAEAEGQTAVAKYMDMVNKVEEVHANLYKKALGDLLAHPVLLHAFAEAVDRRERVREIANVRNRGSNFGVDHLKAPRVSAARLPVETHDAAGQKLLLDARVEVDEARREAPALILNPGGKLLAPRGVNHVRRTHRPLNLRRKPGLKLGDRRDARLILIADGQVEEKIPVRNEAKPSQTLLKRSYSAGPDGTGRTRDGAGFGS